MTRSDFTIHCVSVTLSGLGYAGAVFVLYGTVAAWTGRPWDLIEAYVEPTSVALTLLGTLATALSIYQPQATQRPPDNVSKWVTAPVVIGATLVAIALALAGRRIPGVVVNGFSMLAIAGGLFRLRPHPSAP